MGSDGFPYPVDQPGNFAASASDSLTARLKQCSAGKRTYVNDLMAEAAAEIQRLRERLEDKTSSLRVEIAAKQGAHNEIRIMEMAIRRAVRRLDAGFEIQPESPLHHELKDTLP